MTTLLKISDLTRHGPDHSKALEFEFLNNFSSVHTRKAYKRDIMAFIRFYKEELGLSVLKDCERLHMVAYKEFLTNNDHSPKTINRKISSVSSYFQFLMEKSYFEFNPVDGVKRPKQIVKQETNDLTDEEVSDLFEVISQKASLLHKAVLTTFFTTGIRKSELIDVKRSDLQEVNGELTLSVMAKGGKKLIKFLLPECAEAINNYIHNMESKGRAIEPQDWLFQPSKNPKNSTNLERPLVPSSIDYIFTKYCKMAGINKRISPHSARATYIGSSLDGGADLLKVSKDVGHSSVKTTEHYNKRKNTLRDSPARSLGYAKKMAI